MRLLLTAFVLLSSISAFARKDEGKKISKDHACQWLQPSTSDWCDGKSYAQGYIQCGPYIVTGYCKAEYKDDARACLQEDSGKTYDCYQKTLSTFDQRMKALGKGGVVPHPVCSWATDSFLPANDIDVAPQEKASGCENETWVYRRASCPMGSELLTPMLFCRMDTSVDPVNCLREDGDSRVHGCRLAMEPLLKHKQLQIMNGGTAGSGARQ